MRRFLRLTLPVLGICLLVGNVAFAQGRGGRGMRPMSGGALMGVDQVQKELKITDEQKTKIGEVLQSLRPPEGTNFGNMSQEERDKFFADMQKKGEEAGKKIQAEVLTPEQTSRFKQVELWVAGSRALFENAEVGKQLTLTEDQKGAIKTITEESDKKIGELFRASFGQGVSDEDRAKNREQIDTLRNETNAECMAVLTDDQQAKLTKMKGPKFQLDMSQLGRGRRGGQ
jgi:Spy/CpxP family protein refolding chaperone